MKRQDLKRKYIQQQFLKLGYRANFVSNPLNKQIATIEMATDTQPPTWIHRASWKDPVEEAREEHPAAFKLWDELLGVFLWETGQKITH